MLFSLGLANLLGTQSFIAARNRSDQADQKLSGLLGSKEIGMQLRHLLAASESAFLYIQSLRGLILGRVGGRRWRLRLTVKWSEEPTGGRVTQHGSDRLLEV